MFRNYFVVIVSVIGYTLLSLAEDVTFNQVFATHPYGFHIDTKDRTMIVADVYPQNPGEEMITISSDNSLHIFSMVDGTELGTLQIPTATGLPATSHMIGTPCVANIGNFNQYSSVVIPVFANNLEGSIKRGYTQLVIFWGSLGGLDANNYSLSPVYNLSSPFVVARDVNGDGSDELFLSGIEHLSWEDYSYDPDHNLWATIWSLRYASTAIKVSTDGAQTIDFLWTHTDDTNPNYMTYGSFWDVNNQFPTRNPTIDFMRHGPSFFTSQGQHPSQEEYHACPVDERVCPTISRESGNFILSTVFTLPKKTVNDWTNFNYNFVNTYVFMVNINAVDGTIFGGHDGNPATDGLRWTTSSLDFGATWQTDPNWACYGVRNNYFHPQMGENTTIASGPFLSHEAPNTIKNHVCWTTYGACGGTQHEYAIYNYITENLVSDPTWSHDDFCNDGINTALFLPHEILEETDTDPELSIHGYSIALRPLATGYDNYLVTNTWRFPHGYGLWARTPHIGPQGYDINPDYLTLNNTGATGTLLSAQTTIVTYLRTDLTQSDPVHNAHVTRPVFIGTAANDITSWSFVTFNGTDDPYPHTDARNRYYSPTTPLEGTMDNYSLCPAPALTYTMDENNNRYLTAVSLLPTTGGTKAVGYKLRQAGPAPLPAFDLPYEPEKITTQQAYQNFRHTNCIQELWRNETITQTTTWENRLLIDHVEVNHEMYVKGGTILEFVPGSDLAVSEVVNFETNGGAIVFYNPDTTHPVKICICGNGRFIGTPEFRKGFYFEINSINSQDIRPVLSNITLPITANVVGIDFSGIDANHHARLTNVNVKGSYGSCTGISIENCSANLLIDNCTVTHCHYGIVSTYSNAQLIQDNILANDKYGITWTQDYPGQSDIGRINESVFTDNGTSIGNAGLWCYASRPAITCCVFTNNNSYAVDVTASASPTFYDPVQVMIGANLFNATGNNPIIHINHANPLMPKADNVFNFGPPAYVMADDNPDLPVLPHCVYGNMFNPPVTIDNFNPPLNAVWSISPQALQSLTCGSPWPYGGMYEGMMQAFNQLALGDKMLANNQPDSASYFYNLVFQTYGDTTWAGIAALSRMAPLDPNLPPVRNALEKMECYLKSYSYDIHRNFIVADAYRDTILQCASHYDSLRVAYDLAVSEVLRIPHNQTQTVGAAASSASLIARRHRQEAFNRLVGLDNEANRKGIEGVVPANYKLYPVYPNPFNSTTQIHFDLPVTGRVKVVVYDVTGRYVKELADKNYTAGRYQIEWNGANASGQKVSTGVYFIVLRTDHFTATKKAVLIK